MPRPRKVTIAEPEPKPAKSKEPKGDKPASVKAKNAKAAKDEQPVKKMKIDYEAAFSHDGKDLAQLVLGMQKNNSNASKVIKDMKKIYEKVK